ncbi:MAG: lysylphosphatidylglycerol synthase domain-containing protein [Actinomycetota bacterium]|nr:lysylphosphatidylglycerol synthase domain-containing protein [Actinomycetota bacterium]
MRRPLRNPIVVSAVATALAAVAVLAVAHATGADAIGRAFNHVDPRWIGLIAGAELLAYAAYVIAYRSLAQIHGHAPLSLPVVALVVVAGFGPFAIGGGFGIDKRVLHGLQEDERSAQVRVVALGILEWAVLAPTTCVVAIVFLVEHANILPSLLWPWAVGVPAGLAIALWASSPERAERLSRIGGERRDRLARALEGVGVLHTLIRNPGDHIGAWVGTALYWAAEIAAFYGGLRTFGLDPGAGKVILAYATGYAATRRSLPLGGAGVTEVLMTYSLYWVREPLAPALAAVVAYRAFNFLLVATPALIARRQLRPVLAVADELSRSDSESSA